MSTLTNESMIHRNHNGDKVPGLGFGTWQLKDAECRNAIETALDAGYRHIDTAQAYENENEVGETLATSGIPREEIFLTTKVWHEQLTEVGVKKSFQESLKKLKVEYVDLLLIHWDNEDVPMQQTISAMNDLEVEGTVKHIGVSNFTVPKLEEAAKASSSPLFANQIEYHPFLTQDPIRSWCLEQGVLVTAYCPIARGKVMEEPVLKEIGEAHGKSPVQVTLRWMLQQPKLLAIPKSADPDHIRANIDIFDFTLSPGEMDRIFDLERGERLIDPSFAPDWSESS